MIYATKAQSTTKRPQAQNLHLLAEGTQYIILRGVAVDIENLVGTIRGAYFDPSHADQRYAIHVKQQKRALTLTVGVGTTPSAKVKALAATMDLEGEW